MAKPVAVVISDIHFNINTLPVARAALQSAITTANTENLPLVIAGDLNDTKAIIRAEVANTLLKLFKQVQTHAYILVGNHDLVNEKGTEHGLQYLASNNVTIVDTVTAFNDFTLIPYQSTNESFISALERIPAGALLIVHQGFQGAFMGEYIQDKSSVPLEAVKKYKVVSGHYHRHQVVGSVTYIGNPYTLSYAEANDGPKGFLVLNSDGTFTRHDLMTLRKHVVLNFDYNDTHTAAQSVARAQIKPEDIVWVKVAGLESDLKKLDKAKLGHTLFGHNNYKLDLIPTANDNQPIQNIEKLTDFEIFDSLINKTAETQLQKQYLKELLREIIERVG